MRCSDYVNTYSLICCDNHLNIIQKTFLSLSHVLTGDHVNSYCKRKDLILKSCPAGDSNNNPTATPTISTNNMLNNNQADVLCKECTKWQSEMTSTSTLNINSKSATMTYNQNDLTSTYRQIIDKSLLMRHLFNSLPFMIFDSSPPSVTLII